MGKKVAKGESGRVQNMLDVSFCQDQLLNQIANVKLRAFDFCVHGEFLAALFAFFTTQTAEEDLLDLDLNPEANVAKSSGPGSSQGIDCMTSASFMYGILWDPFENLRF